MEREARGYVGSQRTRAFPPRCRRGDRQILHLTAVLFLGNDLQEVPQAKQQRETWLPRHRETECFRQINLIGKKKEDNNFRHQSRMSHRYRTLSQRMETEAPTRRKLHTWKSTNGLEARRSCVENPHFEAK